jgi:D-alanine-D-alanine ligase
MNIGITYDLRSDYLAMGFSDEETAEFDRESTVDAVESALRALGHSTVRIGNIFALVKRLSNGERWDLVFNFAEGLCGTAREAQIPALLEAYGIQYTFSDPLIMSACLDKPMAKKLVAAMGIPTPAFAVVENVEDIKNISLPFPLFAKPAAEGTSKGINEKSIVSNLADLESTCTGLLRQFNQPVLIEEYLPGREFTVGIIGTGKAARHAAVLEVKLRVSGKTSDVYSYKHKENCEELIDYSLANDELAMASAQTALNAWRALFCRDAGRVDIRVNSRGVPNFIEVNPLAGLNPEHSDLPIMWTLSKRSYTDLIKEIAASAMSRPMLMDDKTRKKISNFSISN